MRQALYGGYSGDLSPDEAVAALLKEERAKLVDLRPQAAREAAGVPDLRRSARGKALVAAVEALPASVRGAVRDPKSLELARLALRVRGATPARGRVIFMDGGNGDAVAAARALAQLGGRKAQTLRGGFPAWADSRLGVRPKADYAMPALSAVTEDLVDAAQGAILTTQGAVSETLSDPFRLATLGAGLVGTVAAVANWELVLEELGVLGLMGSVAWRLLSYDSLDELTQDLVATAQGAAKAALSAGTTVAGAVGTAASTAASTASAAKQAGDGSADKLE